MNDKEASILKGVSRSFYLSLRLLPEPMRDAASVAYLLARASDTIADASDAPVEDRLKALEEFEHNLCHHQDGPSWSVGLLDSVTDIHENRLLRESNLIWSWMHGLPVPQLYLVADVVTTILQGQRKDLEYFSNKDQGEVRSLADGDELDDYTWKVAGCVGEFWTKLGYLTMGDRYSKELEGVMIRRGIRYGKGLQLVNILRDLPKDLAMGRCYLPVKDPSDRKELMQVHQQYMQRAAGLLNEGILYAECLGTRRLQVATAMPAMIGFRTLSKLQGVSWEQLESGIKVGRESVYLYLLLASMGIFHVGRSVELTEVHS